LNLQDALRLSFLLGGGGGLFRSHIPPKVPATIRHCLAE
jgi:hypothetical protein